MSFSYLSLSKHYSIYSQKVSVKPKVSGSQDPRIPHILHPCTEHWLLFHQNIAIISSVAANEFHFRLQSFLVWSLARLLCVDKWLFWIKGRLISIQKKYPQKIFDVANKIFTGLFWYIFLTGFVCSYCLERLFYLFLLIDSFGDSFFLSGLDCSLFLVWRRHSLTVRIFSQKSITKL